MHTRRLVKRSILGSRVYAPGVSPVSAAADGAPVAGMPPPDSRDGSASSSGAPPPPLLLHAPGMMMKQSCMNGYVDPQQWEGVPLSPEAVEDHHHQQHQQQQQRGGGGGGVCESKRFGPRSTLDPEAPRSVSLLEQKRKVVVSSSIDVPHARRSEAEADMDKVTAAMVLTSLSTSPLVRSPPVRVSEGLSGSWKDSSSVAGGPFTPSSYSSSGGYWSWSAPSDQSNPSTPSPPLSADSFKPFRSSMPGLGGAPGGPPGGPPAGGGGGGGGPEDPSLEEQDGSSLLFDEPIPRKRKNSMKVMFKCLWKNCGKVLSTAAGIQRHIRTAHLGRNCDSESSDGEEDFYYAEIKLNTDSVADGLSSLSPVSPSVLSSSSSCPAPPPAPAPPTAPPPQSAASPPRQATAAGGGDSAAPAETRVVTANGGGTPLSRSAPSALYLIHADHAYQATAPVSIPSSNADSAGSFTPTNGNTFSISWQSPPVTFTGNSVSPSKSQGFGEQRAQTIAVLSSPPRATSAISRKVRGEGKKCRKVYGMENRDMWCTACRWKKACQRFTD